MPKKVVGAAKRFWGSVNMVAVCLSVLALSVTVNLLQAQRLRILDGGSQDGTVGARLAHLNVTMPDGRRVPLSSGDAPDGTIIYFYSESCGWCERNRPNVRALRKAVRGRYRFVAVTTDPRSTGDMQDSDGADLSGTVSQDTRRAMGLGGTPHTLLLSPDGVVLQSWRGAYSGSTLREVQTYFGLSLPGLEAPRSPSE
jgi:hypothetical protein